MSHEILLVLYFPKLDENSFKVALILRLEIKRIYFLDSKNIFVITIFLGKLDWGNVNPALVFINFIGISSLTIGSCFLEILVYTISNQLSTKKIYPLLEQLADFGWGKGRSLCLPN